MTRRKTIGIVFFLISLILCAALVSGVVAYFHQRYLGILANGHDFWPTFATIFGKSAKQIWSARYWSDFSPASPAPIFTVQNKKHPGSVEPGCFYTHREYFR